MIFLLYLSIYWYIIDDLLIMNTIYYHSGDNHVLL